MGGDPNGGVRDALVKNWMSKSVITIGEDDSMQDVLRLMKAIHPHTSGVKNEN